MAVGRRWIDRRRGPNIAKRGGVGGDYTSLVAGFEEREAGALASNKAREQEIRDIYGGIIGQYEEGGAFREAGLADIESTKTKAVGAGTQQMISSGLYGTTTAAAIPVQAEAQAGQSRLKLEDLLQQRTTQAKLGLGSFIERIQEPYPDYSQLLQASSAQAQLPNQRKGGGVQYR
jgi:hypothetical protein